MASSGTTDGDSQSYEKRLKDVVREKIRFHDDQELDNSILIADLNDVRAKYNLWQRELPDIQPFYAVKCNEDRHVLQALDKLGCSFDCASEHEMKLVLSLGVDPARIIFANTVKTESMLRFAAKHEVSLMTFDNEVELSKIKKHFPTARLILRIKVDGDKNTVVQLNRKFGCPRERIKHLLSTAKRHVLNVIGISFHIGSFATDATAYTTAIHDARRAHDIAVQLGFDMQILDVGGGFPGCSKSSDLFRKFARTIREALRNFYPGVKNLRIIAEPGTFFAQSAFTLCLKVIGKTPAESCSGKKTGRKCSAMDNGFDDSTTKKIASVQGGVFASNGIVNDYTNDGCTIICSETANLDLNSDRKFMYYLNDGAHGYFSCKVMLESTDDLDFQTVQDLSERPISACSLWGPTCSNLDITKDDVKLPELHPGDWLYVRDAGAYWGSLSTRFNGMPSPTVYYMSRV